MNSEQQGSIISPDELVNPADYAAAITESWRDTVQGVIRTGRLLIEAKAKLEHGEFGKMFKAGEVPFGESTGRRLMAVATHPIFSKRAHGHVLPSSWRTLYELTKLPEDRIAGWIADGRIKPGMERPAVRKLARELRREDAQVTEAAFVTGDYRLLECSIDRLAEEMEPESADLILTDPPYSKEALDLYSELSRFAELILRPGGSLLAMAGQSYLPDIFRRLNGDLQYHWTLAYLTPGGQAPQIWQRKVNTFWKPILWFVKGAYTGPWVGDVPKSPVNANDKRFHDWGQSEAGMAELVERFSKPGDLIVDPFLGGGTTGMAAINLGRRFIGADINAEAIQTAASRLNSSNVEQ